jgi:hypothetical protein
MQQKNIYLWEDVKKYEFDILSRHCLSAGTVFMDQVSKIDKHRCERPVFFKT